MFVLIFPKTSDRDIYHSKKNRVRYDQKWVSVWRNVPIILVWFNWDLNFLDRHSNTTQISNFMTIYQVGSQLFHADRQTDRWTDRQTDRQMDRHDEANSRFLQFCKHAYKTITWERPTAPNFKCHVYVHITQTQTASRDMSQFHMQPVTEQFTYLTLKLRE